MLFYKAVINGQAHGQDIKNILYYREGLGINWANQIFGGSEVVAEEVLQEVWPAMQVLLPMEYTLQSIDVYPHNDLFQLNAQVPYTLVVSGETGLRGDESAGVANVFNFRFNLEPTGMMNGVWPPRYGYIAFGPVPKVMVGENGMVQQDAADQARVEMLCERLAGNLESIDPLPCTFYPIRVRHNRVLGSLIKWVSWADVQSCVIRPNVSFRRSRMPE